MGSIQEMKRLIQMIMVVVVITGVTGCASTKAYLVDRGRDATDIVNLGVEWGGLGASAQAGPLMTGVIVSEGDGIGMIGRNFGRYTCADIQLVLVGIKVIAVPSKHKAGFDVIQCMGLPARGSGSYRTCSNPENMFGYFEIHAACGPQSPVSDLLTINPSRGGESPKQHCLAESYVLGCDFVVKAQLAKVFVLENGLFYVYIAEGVIL